MPLPFYWFIFPFSYYLVILFISSFPFTSYASVILRIFPPPLRFLSPLIMKKELTSFVVCCCFCCREENSLWGRRFGIELYQKEKWPFATTVRYSPKPWSIPFLIFILPPLLSSDIYSVKDGEPSNEELEYLSRELAEKWKTLGRRLGFNEAAIDDFDQANKKLKEKAYKMLMAWKQKVGSEATYKVLYDTLCHELVECKHLAEQYCCDKIVGNVSP